MHVHVSMSPLWLAVLKKSQLATISQNLMQEFTMYNQSEAAIYTTYTSVIPHASLMLIVSTIKG